MSYLNCISVDRIPSSDDLRIFFRVAYQLMCPRGYLKTKKHSMDLLIEQAVIQDETLNTWAVFTSLINLIPWVLSRMLITHHRESQLVLPR